jgi:serine/threonine-protein kinase
MEKLVGETLAGRIASEGGLPFDDVIDILTQVLSGLIVAHEKRIVHPDIKPENVFLTKRIGCRPSPGCSISACRR